MLGAGVSPPPSPSPSTGADWNPLPRHRLHRCHPSAIDSSWHNCGLLNWRVETFHSLVVVVVVVVVVAVVVESWIERRLDIGGGVVY